MVVLDEMRGARQNYRANRRAHQFRSRGRVRPRRLGLSKVVDVVSITNDAIGTTVGAKSNDKYSAAALTAFGESLETLQGEVTSNIKHQTSNALTFFTGKPMVEGLGHAFWMRNYRAGLAKWQSADPMGYPDGWNQFAYGVNSPAEGVDLLGARWKYVSFWYSTEYPFQVIMPGGLPLDLSPSPGFWATLISWLAGEGASTVTNYAIDIMLPLWTRYKAYADEQGLAFFTIQPKRKLKRK